MKLSILNDPAIVANVAPAAAMPPFEVQEYQDEADLGPVGPKPVVTITQ